MGFCNLLVGSGVATHLRAKLFACTSKDFQRRTTSTRVEISLRLLVFLGVVVATEVRGIQPINNLPGCNEVNDLPC
jgi:hypothetical protein